MSHLPRHMLQCGNNRQDIFPVKNKKIGATPFLFENMDLVMAAFPDYIQSLTRSGLMK